MSDSKNVYVPTGGIGFTGLLTLIFVVFKLLKIITWHWWVVFLPVIIGTGLWILFLLICLAFLILAAIASAMR